MSGPSVNGLGAASSSSSSISKEYINASLVKRGSANIEINKEAYNALRGVGISHEEIIQAISETNSVQDFEVLMPKLESAKVESEVRSVLLDMIESVVSRFNPSSLSAAASVVVQESEPPATIPKPAQNGSALITGVDQSIGFRYGTNNFSQNDLQTAHETLIANGYEFVGYNGTQKGVAELRVNEGITAIVDKRPNQDPWKGLYISKDVGVASGYAVMHDTPDDPTKQPQGKTSGDLRNGALIRVYLPRDVARSMVVSDIPLGDGFNGKERYEQSKLMSSTHLSQKLGFQLGDSRPYIVSGPQDIENPAHETIVSWGAAQGAVFLPSLAVVSRDGGSVQRENQYEQSISG